MSTAESASTSGRILELDGLRGFAILIVVLDHYVGEAVRDASLGRLGSLLHAFLLGSTGVDLFFVLSGFLIGRILLEARDRPRYFPTFYARRFYRIIPIYYLWVSLYAVASLVARHHFQSDALATTFPIVFYYAFLQNYFLMMNPAQFLWFSPVWSLGVEEQFYLVMPLVVRFTSRVTLVRTLVAVVLIAPLLRYAAFLWYRSGDPNDVAYLWTPCRADSLALGVLATVISSSEAGRRWVTRHLSTFHLLVGALGLSLLASSRALVSHHSVLGATLGRSAVGMTYALLLLVVVHDREGRLAKVFRFGLLRQLGTISYCLYLVHLGVAGVLHQVILHDQPSITTWPGVLVSALSLAVSLGVAKASWAWIEKPLVSRGHRHAY